MKIYFRPLLLIPLFFAVSCASKISHKILLVSFEDDIRPGKEIGQLDGLGCNSTFMGFGPAAPTYELVERAIERSKGSVNARYYNDFTLSYHNRSSPVHQRDCVVLEGKGFK